MEDDLPPPAGLGSVPEFMAALRALKDRSGLSLRELEARAEARGDALPRSTAADLLRRRTLPRLELVTAFVRACGEQERLPEWIRAWERLACGDTANEPAPPASVPPPGPGTDPAAPPSGPAQQGAPAPRTGPPRSHPLAALAAAVLAGAAVTALLLVTVLSGDGGPPGPKPTGTADLRLLDPMPLTSAGSWARIRPARTPGLCLTEGRDRSGNYDSAVAVQRPCADPGPRTFLQPVGEDFTHIKWEHPVDKVMGCLTVIEGVRAAGLVEPQDDCLTDKEPQLFRIERFRPGDDRGYRLRRAHTGLCIGIRGSATEAGAEAVQQPCDDRPGQRFLVDLVRGGGAATPG